MVVRVVDVKGRRCRRDYIVALSVDPSCSSLNNRASLSCGFVEGVVRVALRRGMPLCFGRVFLSNLGHICMTARL